MKTLLPRRLTVRLVLLNALIFGVCAVSAVAVVVMLADEFMSMDLRDDLGSEVDVMRKSYAAHGLEGVTDMIILRGQYEGGQQARTYRLESTGGQLLAGQYAQWPPELGANGEAWVPYPERGSKAQWLFRAVTLADGSRLLVGVDNFEQVQARRSLHLAAFLGLALAVSYSVIGGFFVNRAALAQVGVIARSAQRIIDGDLQHRIPTGGKQGDEFEELSRTLNQMLNRISVLMAAMGSATDAIAHDLRTPLARLRSSLEQARRRPPRDLDAFFDQNIEQLDQVLDTFSALLQLATVESGALRSQFAAVLFNDVISDAVALYEPSAAARGVRIDAQLPAGAVWVRGDASLLFQSVANLLDNAVKFSPAGGNIELRLQAAGELATLEVLDEGPGIPAQERQRVFDRLYRGDRARRSSGYGLGLSLVSAAAQLMGGTCRVADSTRGARLVLSLPRLLGAEPAAAAPAQPPAPPLAVTAPG